MAYALGRLQASAAPDYAASFGRGGEMADAMDSKSISRKGVGVQVPASAPATQDPLARAMLPVLLHRVANATQHLNGVASLLALDPGALGARSGDLAETSDRVDEVGWLLALLASAQGARLLLARREKHGLRALVGCVRECLRHEGRDLGEPGAPLPELAPEIGDGWQLPWAIGTWLFECGRSVPPGRSLAWRFRGSSEGTRIECVETDVDLAALADRLARELPGAVATREGSGATLRLPRGWLLEPEART